MESPVVNLNFEIFGKQLDKKYINRLIETGYCDTLIAIIYKN